MAVTLRSTIRDINISAPVGPKNKTWTKKNLVSMKFLHKDNTNWDITNFAH